MIQPKPVMKRSSIPTPVRPWRSFSVSTPVYLGMILLIFFGTIAAAQAIGWWSTSGRTSPDGTPVQVTGKNPAEIKGWMTIADVLKAYQAYLDRYPQGKYRDEVLYRIASALQARGSMRGAAAS